MELDVAKTWDKALANTDQSNVYQSELELQDLKQSKT